MIYIFPWIEWQSITEWGNAVADENIAVFMYLLYHEVCAYGDILCFVKYLQT